MPRRNTDKVMSQSVVIMLLDLMSYIQLVGSSSTGSAHGFSGTEIDGSSFAFNGNAVGDIPKQGGPSIHIMRNGTVSNNSVLFNGDMDPESFRKMFCKAR